jgi:hypothetical protein
VPTGGSREVARTDRRWLLAAADVFAGWLGAFAAARALYVATGPHPEVTLFLRRVKSYANKLLHHRVRRRHD